MIENLEDLPQTAKDVLGDAVDECWRTIENAENIVSEKDFAADIVRYLSHIYLGGDV